ncbi:Type II secretory pathway, pullulanase PulA [Mesobaculum littorinae]|uniref:Type II secretory pathway, pullulanase PulA n=1 Tax=Mesobaculum littorinae TaxID=2486419 RepID=A0A438AI96_9RHOB|nr:sulfotransferase domain-containing protein [Mesobaculum littorinae]RVV98429.1 Type II secretory pathway, pullulanase PulA [Mesobaculum littorinae]
MILSPGRRYVFVHIPKTGGTALTLALEGRAMRDDILIGDTPKARRRRGRLAGLATRGRVWKHATLADIEGALPPETLASCRVVTLVRNPWDRMVSYYHWLRAQSFAHPAVGRAQSMPFTAFLRHPDTQAALRAHPYGSYVTGSDGQERETLFLRLEHLETDLPRFEAHLGFTLRPLPRANTSDREAGYRLYYTPETAALVGALCAEDAERFGYSF